MRENQTEETRAGAQKHTPGPLAIINTAAGKPAPIGKEMAIIVDSTGHTVADCQTTTSKPLLECRANAREIVRRYNTFPLLLEAAKAVIKERLGDLELAVKWMKQNGANPNASQDLILVMRALAAATATEGEGKENL